MFGVLISCVSTLLIGAAEVKSRFLPPPIISLSLCVHTVAILTAFETCEARFGVEATSLAKIAEPSGMS